MPLKLTYFFFANFQMFSDQLKINILCHIQGVAGKLGIFAHPTPMVITG